MSKWLAAEIGASESEVSRWRWGLHVPTQATQEKIAAALRRDVTDLFVTDVTQADAA